jgi:protein-S-isoprenylcysteine O-methyltransferase Ste14
MLAGIALRQWSIRVLGRFFSTTVQVTSDQRIVTNGPYSVVRHPAYSGALLTLLGLGLSAIFHTEASRRSPMPSWEWVGFPWNLQRLLSTRR